MSLQRQAQLEIKRLVSELNEEYGWFYQISTDLTKFMYPKIGGSQPRRVYSEDRSCWWLEWDFTIKGSCEFNPALDFEVKMTAYLENNDVRFEIEEPFSKEMYEVKNLNHDFWFYVLLQVINNN